ncbi:hypothetical protein ARALYDRAFT_338791 [Arabidopsis lyrata subsp. lyrata]|uniref:No apical meristem-associated C-terminal domain-containing protein n=1 Tax=Arabidopsis lyrata subsp. lyrata TaxID=81972 RepID=D7KT05_ARALL|nr:hypothetical protein ARALYDRAFT_338791 [Arabidopsis lyrata subsp. lyrata]
MNPTPKTTSSNKRKADDAPPSAGSNVFEEESRPPGIKAMKAKRNKGKGKVGPALATDDNIWEKKEKDMAQREKLQKMSVYKTLLARSESLDEDEKVQEDMGLDSMYDYGINSPLDYSSEEEADSCYFGGPSPVW